ncbi:MAG: hypothetical protein M1824_002140 [Vezdaea acicularis]|nr:MAG: hypothetical protein M1824_002140 [Vezdaea acicularis]
MPKVLSYTPPWLSRTSPGFKIFESPEGTSWSKTQKARPTSSNGAYTSPEDYRLSGPRRTIAKRGTEIFVAAGKQIRWTDLRHLKDDWEEQSQPRGSRSRKRREESVGDTEAGYRTLRISLGEDIRQMIPSPNGNLMAILTSHTVHIAVLPDPRHLKAADSGAIKLKSFQLGPTTHVTTQSPIVSALWHPLGVLGKCLVTVTKDAVVRIWEVSPEDRWSFDCPALAVDLKKLADGLSSDEDFGAANFGRSKGFSPDSFEMEVAAACFGGQGKNEENGWAAMTLWVAMREGDIYALCPLLPNKWQPQPTLIPSLSVSAVTKRDATDNNPEASSEDRRHYRQQMQWMKELDEQEPIFVPGSGEFDQEIPVFKRPNLPSSIPRLQGPFRLETLPEDSDDEEEVLITDIHAIAPKIDADELMRGEDIDFEYEELSQEGLSIGVLCVLSSNGRIHVCLDLHGVEAEWLPEKRFRSHQPAYLVEQKALLTFESIDTIRSTETRNSALSWPTFSLDPLSRYGFFVTHGQGVTFLSLQALAENLENELENSTDPGSAFRIDIITKGESTLRERILDTKDEVDEDVDEVSGILSESLIYKDHTLGYFLLTANDGQPYAISFDQPDALLSSIPEEPFIHDFESERLALPAPKPRPIYDPPRAFYMSSPLPSSLAKFADGRHQHFIKGEIRLSSATLEVMTAAHRVLSQRTHQLGVAAAELFRRCERLQEEFRDQIKRLDELSDRIEEVTGEDYDEDDGEDVPQAGPQLERRLIAAKTRQKELVSRYAALRRKLAAHGSGDLSDKEKAWVKEVNRLSSSVLAPTSQEDLEGRKTDQPWFRYQEARQLADELVKETKELEAKPTPDKRVTALRVSSEIRKAKIKQVQLLMDRESALVEATKNRLESLIISAP